MSRTIIMNIPRPYEYIESFEAGYGQWTSFNTSRTTSTAQNGTFSVFGGSGSNGYIEIVTDATTITFWAFEPNGYAILQLLVNGVSVLFPGVGGISGPIRTGNIPANTWTQFTHNMSPGTKTIRLFFISDVDGGYFLVDNIRLFRP